MEEALVNRREKGRRLEDQRTFSDADLKRLIELLHEHKPPEHICRFPGIDPEDMSESVKFYKNMNKSFNSGKHVVFMTILVGLVGGVMATIWLGIVAKVKETLTP